MHVFSFSSKSQTKPKSIPSLEQIHSKMQMYNMLPLSPNIIINQCLKISINFPHPTMYIFFPHPLNTSTKNNHIQLGANNPILPFVTYHITTFHTLFCFFLKWNISPIILSTCPLVVSFLLLFGSTKSTLFPLTNSHVKEPYPQMLDFCVHFDGFNFKRHLPSV